MVTLRYDPAPAIEVWSHHDGTPERFRWRRRVYWIWHIEKISDLGWKSQLGDSAISQRHYRVQASDSLICTIYRDNLTGRWHMYAILD